MRKIFDNPHALTESIIRQRSTDAYIKIETYTESELQHRYVAIDSTLPDITINLLLSTPATQAELDAQADFLTQRQQLRDEYLSTLATLEQIETTTNPTNAQVVAAIKFLAKTLRLLLKLIARNL